jgi:hypothetical protein
MPPKFTWSFSSISDFDTCPAQYAAKRYYKTVPFVESDAIRWGLRVHKVAEKMLKGEPCVDAEVMKLVGPHVKGYLARPRTDLLVEKQMCVNTEWKPTDWFGKDAWGRGILDLGIINGDSVFMCDWKTGKPKQGTDQLRIFAVFLALCYPELQVFNGEYVWLKDGTKSTMSPLLRKDLLPVIKWIGEKISRMQQAWEYEIFPARKNGLCRSWCPVSDCVHCG